MRFNLRFSNAPAKECQAIHDARTVHRDLRPGNVLLMEDGTPKITGFGLAEVLDGQSVTQHGAVIADTVLGVPHPLAHKFRWRAGLASWSGDGARSS